MWGGGSRGRGEEEVSSGGREGWGLVCLTPLPQTQYSPLYKCRLCEAVLRAASCAPVPSCAPHVPRMHPCLMHPSSHAPLLYPHLMHPHLMHPPQVGLPYELEPGTLNTLGESTMGGQLGQRLAGHYRVVAGADGRKTLVTFGAQVRGGRGG